MDCRVKPGNDEKRGVRISPPLNSGIRLLSIGPNDDSPARLVLEPANNNENEIHKGPDPQAAQREYLEYSGSDLADIKPVCSEYSKEPAQQQGYETKLGTRARAAPT
jgi:hypothetical protein